MQPEAFEEMFALEDYYWWFRGRERIVMSLLDKMQLSGERDGTVVDLGCGTGLILNSLNQRFLAVGLDFSGKALAFCRKRGLRRLVRADVDRLPLATSAVDLLLGLDLLEHIENDAALMQDLYRVLRAGGRIVLSAPAHQFLWSEHDEALYHYRRYSCAGLKQLLEQSGFVIERMSYAISFLFLPIVIFRMVQRIWGWRREPRTHMIVFPRLVNSFFTQLLKVEAWLLKFMNLPFGVSLLAIGRKPE